MQRLSRLVVTVVLVAGYAVSVSAASPNPNAAVGTSCRKAADCGSRDLFCEFHNPGCSAVGECAPKSCVNDPMNYEYCGCDGNTHDTASGCRPDVPFAAPGRCP